MLRDEFLITEKKRANVRAVWYPDVRNDVDLLTAMLPSARGNVYFVSGEANHKVYYQLKSQFKRALEKGTTIHFLTGPIISIPDELEDYKEQEERVSKSLIMKLAMANERFLLYPSEKRQPYHYRVFEENRTTIAFEDHDLNCGSPRLWIWENSFYEAEARIEDFKKRTKSIYPVKDSFSDYFIFLTETEISKLKEWASDENITPEAISLDNCRKYWSELGK